MMILRRVLCYFLVAVYLVLCPLLILYGFGYIFTPKVPEGLVKTGLLHLHSLPEGASIYVGKKQTIEKTPATIRNLLPAEYEVKVSRSGYRPWQRKIPIAAGKAVAFDKILLLPKELKKRCLLAQSFENLEPVKDTPFLLLFKSKVAGDVTVFNWREETVRPLLTEDSPFRRAVWAKTFTMRKSTAVLALVKTGGESHFLWCELDKDIVVVKDLSALFKLGEPSEVRWEGDNPESILALYENRLHRLDLKRKVLLESLLEGVQGFDLFRGKIFALRASSIIQMNADGERGSERVIEKGIFLENLFRDAGTFKMDFISGRAVCFWGPRGEFFTNELPYRFVSEGLLGYEPDAAGRKLVLWQKERLGILDFTKAMRRKGLFERGPEIEWIFEKKGEIRQAYFVYGTSQALFCDGREAVLIPTGEVDAPVERLVEVWNQSTVFYSESTGKLYYLEPSQGHFFAAEILPEWPGLPGVFSEFEVSGKGEGT